MSQKMLAEKIGVTRQTIIAIEKDKYSPSLEVAFKISNEFGVPLETVFNYKQLDKINCGKLRARAKMSSGTG